MIDFKIVDVLVKKGVYKQLDFILLGKNKSIQYKGFHFSIINNKLLNLEEYCSINEELIKNQSIVSIREHEDLDNYFIFFSSQLIMRINFTDYQGDIVEELTLNFLSSQKNTYYWKVRKWYEESVEIILEW